MFKRHLHVKKHGFKQYQGSEKEILNNIIKDCFNGKYFQTSTGHFSEFFTRDFGFSTESLLKLGYKEQVLSTLNYALNIFQKHNKITVAISPNQIPFDFPNYAVDSLPYLIHSLKLAKANDLIKKHKDFLNQQINIFYNLVINKDTNLVNKKHFSSMKDHAKRSSSCYDNCMVLMLKNDLNELNLNNPFKINKEQIIKTFWNGSFFNDTPNSTYIASDANIIPFFTKVITNKKMLKSALNAIEPLTKPFPIKYTIKKTKMNFMRYLAPDYEQNTIWMHIGPLYVQLLKSINKPKAQQHINTYKALIRKHKTFLELYTPDGQPYKTALYTTDEGMLWSANLLTLL